MATNPFDKYLQNDLADFAGLRVTGTVPVTQEILNDLLQTVLADMASPAAQTGTKAVAETVAQTSDFDAKRLLKHLKKAEIRAETGRLVLDFDISVAATDK